MANDYLVYKWKLWYKSLDVNHDGTLSEADMNDCIDNYEHLSHFSEARVAEVKSGIRQYWQKVVLRGHTGGLSEDEFVSVLKQAYTANKSKFSSELQDSIKVLAHVFDENNDGSLSLEEVIHAYQSFGHTKESNLAAEKDAFQSFNPVDGLVPANTIVDAWIKFLCSDNASEQDLIKESLEKGA